MSIHCSQGTAFVRVRPLAACVAMLLGIDLAGARTAIEAFSTAAVGSIAQPSTTFVVKSCDDDGPDSLRAAIEAANTLGGSNSIQFDSAAMQCSRITLSTGELKVTATDLAIEGTAQQPVTIDGGYSFGHFNRIINHQAQGTLRLSYVTLTDSLYSSSGNQPSRGGCVFTFGTLDLDHASMDSCRAEAYGAAAAQGGAAYAETAVHMTGSVITNSGAISLNGSASGGALFVGTGGFHSTDSSLSSSLANSYAASPIAHGGAIDLKGPAVLERTTLSGNRALSGGGLNSTSSAALVNSSISTNFASAYGGLQVSLDVSIYNTTISSNVAYEYGRISGIRGASIYSVSSIIAGNVNRNGGIDVAADVQSSDGHVSGASNLIIAALQTSLPADTRSGCPRLAPLTNNGGATRTHALLPGSDAIDRGDDTFDLGVDQRGQGFPRVVGARTDIGSYEWGERSGDFINRGGFEICN